MKEHISRFLFAYWNDVRAGRLAPKRFEIEPSCLASILPDTFILERPDAETARFRLAGTRICEAFGAEFRGSNFFDFFDPEERADLERQFSVMANRGAVGVLTMHVASASDKTATFEILLLPLLHTQNAIDRFLGSMAADKHYDWFGTEPVVRYKVASFEMIWPDGRPQALAGKGHHQSPFLPHVRTARIVRSDRRNFRVYEGGLGSQRDDK
jgi:hypothetical protein